MTIQLGEMKFSSIHVHNITHAEARSYGTGNNSGYLRLRSNDDESYAVLHFEVGEFPKAQTIEDVINANVEGLAERIEEVMDNVNDLDVTFADFALAIACELTGKDLDEAYRQRKEAAA